MSDLHKAACGGIVRTHNRIAVSVTGAIAAAGLALSGAATAVAAPSPDDMGYDRMCSDDMGYDCAGGVGTNDMGYD